ncbi:MAG: DNA primase [Ignavibacteria bacterium]|nr:DNA primase [Ignavibacteria bacterium]
MATLTKTVTWLSNYPLQINISTYDTIVGYIRICKEMEKNITQEIIENINIIDFISEFVNLRRRGSNYVGLCPFHQERTPSFTVSPEKKIFKCFGCGKSGNVISFVMEYYNFGFFDAVKELARRAGINLETYRSEKAKEQVSFREQILQSLNFASKFFHKLLFTQSGKLALSYLRGRGYSLDIIKEFEIGYAPAGWDTLYKEMKSKGFSEQILLGAGLIKPREGADGEYYDVFRERIIFPIHNQLGKVVGFGGRILKETNEQAKYINSPQTEVFDKSKLLFGLYQARNEIRSKNSAVLVEGYADVIGLYQGGVRNAVASCGTSLTQEQLEMLLRYCQTLYIAYDGDEAGQKATERAIQLALPLGFEVLIVKIIADEDPDSLIKKYGARAFINLLENSVSFVRYFVELAQNKGIMSRPAQKSQLTRYILKLINSIPDPLQHDDFIMEFAELTGQSYTQLQEIYKQKPMLKPDKFEKPKPESRPITIGVESKMLPEEQFLLRVCIEHTESFEYLSKFYKFDVSQLISNEGKELFEVLQLHKGKDVLNSILNDSSVSEETKKKFIDIAFPGEEISENWERFGFSNEVDIIKLINTAVIRLRIKKVENQLDAIKKKLISEENSKEEIMKEISELSRLKQKLISMLRQ